MNSKCGRGRPELTIGPLFRRQSAPNYNSQKIRQLDVSIEMATPEESIVIPLFRREINDQDDDPYITMSQLLIDPVVELPFSFKYQPFFGVETGQGTFVPFESFLVGLYEHFRVLRSITVVLEELSNLVDFPKDAKHLCPLAAMGTELGLATMSIYSYGRTVSAEIGWRSLEHRKTGKGLFEFCCFADFRPVADGTLGKGKFNHGREMRIGHLLYQQLRKRLPKHASELFTEEGRCELLSHFEWTPLARMTSEQARHARVKFIKENDALMANPRALAQALKAAQLYAPSSTLWQIERGLSALIDEAKHTVS